ncbi:MAG: hypothetical protein DRJ47_00785 [Thermoprotei archaeon]|nr:MAG: hypothetical protein DRJ47_00785 [Thermoprotei archaeon]
MSGVDDRIRKLEEEMEELKKSIPNALEELRKTVESLKNTTMEMRETISELENPFNLLRIVSSEEDLGRLVEARRRLISGGEPRATGRAEVKKTEDVKPRVLEEAKPTLRGELKPREKEVAEKGVLKKPLEERAVEKPVSVPQPPLTPRVKGFEAGVSMIKWVWTLLDAGFDHEDVIDVSKFCEFMGFLPPKSSEYVSYLVNTMMKARAGGLTLDEFLLIIYSAAKAAGIKLEMEELEETAFSLLRRILKKINYKHGEE